MRFDRLLDRASALVCDDASVADALRDAISDGTAPTHADLVEFCDMLDAKAKEPRK